MNRALIALLGVSAAAIASAEAPPAGNAFIPTPSGAFIDLDKPGALDRVAQGRAAHYRKLTAVLRAAENPHCMNGELRLLRARNEVRDLRCAFLLMTSLPPKRHLSFVLDDVRYAATVTMTYEVGHITPAHERR